MNRIVLFLLLVLSLIFMNVYYVKCARILAVLPTPSISHMVIYHPILRELSLRGHQVVAIIPDPINDPKLTNLTEINIHNVSYGIWAREHRLAEARIEDESSFVQFAYLAELLLKICDSELGHPDVQRIINDPNEKFDLVINEWLMYASTFAFGEHFKCPIVGISSMPLWITGYDVIGVPTHPAYAMDFWKVGGNDLTFWERVDNTLHSIWFRLYYHFVVLQNHDRVAKKHFGNSLKYIGDIERDVSLILVNTNPVFHVSRPVPPTLIEIGGIHMKERKQLPKDLEKFLSDSKDGVIYLSLGSNVKSTALSKDKVEIFIKVFSQLPYNVLWKWESDITPLKSPKILFRKWFPQQDVLDHPNIKVFITQGGLQSIEESIRSCVPLIGIPFAGDQDYNVARIKALNIGRRLYLEDLNEITLNETLSDVINNPRYKDKITEVSSVFWDQPLLPLHRAIFWIEYVIRNKGAKLLRSENVDIPWYKYLLIDVIVFFIVCIIVILYFLKLIITVIQTIWKSLIGKERKFSKKVKKNIKFKKQ